MAYITDILKGTIEPLPDRISLERYVQESAFVTRPEYVNDFKHNDPNMPGNFNRYIARSVDMDTACSKAEAFVYVKMCRILLIGFIQMDHRDRWCDTKVHVNHGILEKKHYKVPAAVSHFMYYKARRQQELQKKISGKQWKRIGKDYEMHTDKFRESEMFKAITQDSILFGDAAFDD